MFSPWVGKIPWKRDWQPTSVFLPGEFHGQRRLEGYSPWGCKLSDTAEQLTHTHTHTHTHTQSYNQDSILSLIIVCLKNFRFPVLVSSDLKTLAFFFFF